MMGLPSPAGSSSRLDVEKYDVRTEIRDPGGLKDLQAG